MMIGVEALATYWRVVPSIGFNCGAPSNVIGLAICALRWTLAVCGTLLAMTASCAWVVPGTEDFTFSIGLVVRDLREIRRQARGRHVLPRPRGRGRAEPAPGDEHVGVLVVDVLEHAARRVGHVEQLRVRDRIVVGLPVDDDELGRLRLHVDDRHGRGLQRRLRSLRVRGRSARHGIAVAGGQDLVVGLLDVVLAAEVRVRDLPRALDRGGRHPAVEEVEVELARARLQDDRARVDQALHRRARSAACRRASRPRARGPPGRSRRRSPGARCSGAATRRSSSPVRMPRSASRRSRAMALDSLALLVLLEGRLPRRRVGAGGGKARRA